MSRKSILLGLGLLALIAGVTAVVLVLLLNHEPADYHRLALPPGQERQKHSKEFEAKCFTLYNGMANDAEWRQTFTEAQINSYFDEEFVRSGLSEKVLPDYIREPRVSITPERVRLAFRYVVSSWCSAVVTFDFRVWLASNEPNVLALELQALHAGSLPVSAQSLLERVADVLRRQDIEVTLYRLPQSGNPVALLRFQANQPRPTVRLEQLELRQGELVIGGRSNDAAALRTMLTLPLTGLTPAAAE
jgi:hypothetical protein